MRKSSPSVVARPISYVKAVRRYNTVSIPSLQGRSASRDEGKENPPIKGKTRSTPPAPHWRLTNAPLAPHQRPTGALPARIDGTPAPDSSLRKIFNLVSLFFWIPPRKAVARLNVSMSHASPRGRSPRGLHSFIRYSFQYFNEAFQLTE